MINRPVEILMVEDNPTDVMLIQEALADTKMLSNLHVAEDGVQAMEFLHRQGEHASAPRPDMVLLDLNMPRKGGQEVLAEIKGDEHLKHIPTVILTTSRAEADIWKAYGLHANCYIPKPVDFDAFADIVRTIQNFWFIIALLPSSQARHGK